MGTYKGHFWYSLLYLIPLVVVFLMLHISTTGNLLTSIPFFFLGVFLPDVDSPASKMRKIFTILLTLAVACLMLLHQILFAFILLLVLLSVWMLKHRGLTHTMIFGITISISISLYSNLYNGAGFLFGFISHLRLDR